MHFCLPVSEHLYLHLRLQEDITGVGGKPVRKLPEDSANHSPAKGHPRLDVEAQENGNVEAGRPVTY